MTRGINLALRIARMSTHSRVRIGAVIIKDGKLLGWGANMDEKHPLQEHYNEKVGRVAFSGSLHAEVNALIKAYRNGHGDMAGATMFVGRLNKLGTLAMCRPCKACVEALHDVNIRDIVYTDMENIWKETLPPRAA